MWLPPRRGPRRFPRLDPSCLLNVVFCSPDSARSPLHLRTSDNSDSALHLGTADSADSTLHLGAADSADSTLHLSIAYRADSTLHLRIAHRVDSHDTTYSAYSHDICLPC